MRKPLFFCVFLTVLLLHDPHAVFAQGEKALKKTVKRYNECLRDTFPDPESSAVRADPQQLKILIESIDRLLSAPISNPGILQKFHFIDSYEVLFHLERNPPPGTADLVSDWEKKLKELDAKAYQVNRFFARPSARWVVQEARSLPARPTRKMLGGTIEREEGTVYVSAEGERCPGSGKGCEKVRYVLLKCLVRGVDDPETVRQRLHAFPPAQANRRVTRYWEVPLDKETLLIRRNYHLKPLPGYEGTMENYHQSVFRDRQRIVILEENSRVGKFILRTDNAAVYIKSPPYGVTVAMIFTGKYAMEKFFRMMVGNKQVEEPLGVLCILRQFVQAPEKGVEEAVRAGREEFLEQQAP